MDELIATVRRWQAGQEPDVSMGEVYTTLSALAARSEPGADWQETARQYAENTDYWRKRAETCEAARDGGPTDG